MSLNIFGVTFLYPLAIILILPLAILLIWLIKKDFLKLEGKEPIKSSNVIIITRILLIFLILLAISSPYQEREKVKRSKGDGTFADAST